MENENKWEYDYSGSQNGAQASPLTPPAEMPASAPQQAAPQAAAQPADTGYVNVGSSGTGAANLYEGGALNAQAAAQSAAPQQPAQNPNLQAGYQAGPVPPYGAQTGSAYGYAGYVGGAVPPYAPGSGAGAAPGGWRPPQANAVPPKKHKSSHGTAARVLTLVLALGVGFGGGLAGGYFAGSGEGTRVVMQTVERDTSAAKATTTSTDGDDLSVSEVSALVTPSVVVITTEEMVTTNGWYGQSQVVSGAGSGVIMSADGYIMTCAHVVSGASHITVTIDGTDYTATVVGSDSESDIAVLKIDATGLTPAVMGDSDGLAVGEQVVAVGNPLGELGGTVTEGIVSALNRDVVVEDQEMNLIQTSASVSPGNSGGGLFNMAGELIGIVNAKSNDSSAEGLGFAIPINTAYAVAKQLVENGYVSGRPALGVTILEVSDESTAAYYGLTTYGVYIYSVEDGSPAAAAGLQAGDRIISIDDTAVSTKTDLTSYIAGKAVGDTVNLTVARDGKTLTVSVTLAEKTSTSTAANSGSTGNNSQNNSQNSSNAPDTQSGATQGTAQG